MASATASAFAITAVVRLQSCLCQSCRIINGRMQRRRLRFTFIFGSRFSQQLRFSSDTLRLNHEKRHDSRHSKHSLSELWLWESNFMLVALRYDTYIQSQLVSQAWNCSSLWRQETIIVFRFSVIYFRDSRIIRGKRYTSFMTWYVFAYGS